MSDTMEGKGSCLCGRIQIIAKTMSTKVGACHCSMCRTWGGGPFLAVDCGIEVTFTSEEDITVYQSSEWAERGFCSKCGTHLFYRLRESGQLIMPVGLFEPNDMFQFDHQIFVDKKPSYYSFANETENMTEAEIFEKYAP